MTVTTNNVPHGQRPPTCSGAARADFEVGDTTVGAGSCFDEESDNLTSRSPSSPPRARSGRGSGHPVRVGHTRRPPRARTPSSSRPTTATRTPGGRRRRPTTLPPVNDPPSCSGLRPARYEVGEPGVAGCCFDEEGDQLTITITQQPTKGTAQIEGQGTADASVQLHRRPRRARTPSSSRPTTVTRTPTRSPSTTTNAPAVNDPPAAAAFGEATSRSARPRPPARCFDDEDDPLNDHDHPAAHQGHRPDRGPGHRLAVGQYTATERAPTRSSSRPATAPRTRARSRSTPTTSPPVERSARVLRPAADSRSATRRPSAAASTRRATTSPSRSPSSPPRAPSQVSARAPVRRPSMYTATAGGRGHVQVQGQRRQRDSAEDTVTTEQRRR